jgi:cell wall-associated NlpC family hydrolase
VTCRPLPVRLSRVVWDIASRAHRRQATLVGLVALILATTVVVAGPAAAEPPQIAAKRAEAQRVLEEIQSLDSQLEHAIEAYNGATDELTRIEGERALNTRHLAIAKNNLVIAQQRLGDRLRAMYTQPQDDSTLAILLGSKSIGEFVDNVETVNSVASQDTQVMAEIKRFKHDVTVRAAFLKRAQARQEQVVAERAATKREIESGLAERQRLVESIKSEIVRLQAEEEARQARLAAEAQQRLQAELSAQKEAAAQAQQEGTDVVGASAITPEGVSVAPPARYGGAVGVAMQYLGTPYIWGGSSPGGFDCSGLVMYAFAQVGVYLPHNAAAQYNYGTPVSRDELEPGDLVFFDGLGHVGIYIGGGQFVHAPHTGDVVKISSLYDGWYSSTYVGARRL